MENTYYVPSQVNTEEFDNIVDKLEADFKELISAQVEAKAVVDYFEKLLRQGETGGNKEDELFWKLADPRSMPADCRVRYVYETTYYATSILVYALRHYKQVAALPNINEVLVKALKGCMGRRFMGAGYDDEIGFIGTMKIFAQCEMDLFVKEYPNLNPEFTQLFTAAMKHLKEHILTGKVKNAWSGKDYIPQAAAVMKLFGHS